MRYTPIRCTLDEVHAHEVHTNEVHTREIHAYAVHAYEIHACEMGSLRIGPGSTATLFTENLVSDFCDMHRNYLLDKHPSELIGADH